MKLLKNIKENLNLAKEKEDLRLMKDEAHLMQRRYERLIKETGESFQALKSQVHFKDERIKELENKIKVYEELILKGSLK
jgi:hypothetical protein